MPALTPDPSPKSLPTASDDVLGLVHANALIFGINAISGFASEGLRKMADDFTSHERLDGFRIKTLAKPTISLLTTGHKWPWRGQDF